jgi:hypothetical protein
MKFTTPCFVRVEDAEKRKELIGWLFSIGYALCEHLIGMDGETPVVVAAFGKFDLWVRTHCKSETCFDCGENIDLFKALAAMNDENDNEQYFVTELAGSSYCLHKNRNTNLDYSLVCRKATAEEIIEHFKEK